MIHIPDPVTPIPDRVLEFSRKNTKNTNYIANGFRLHPEMNTPEVLLQLIFLAEQHGHATISIERLCTRYFKAATKEIQALLYPATEVEETWLT